MTDELKNPPVEEFESLSRPTRGDKDAQGEFPNVKYVGVPNTNYAAMGAEEHELYVGGGDNNIDLNIKLLQASQYPYNAVRETVSGHVQEIDDTPGRERMLFKHRTGAGIDLRPDGSCIITTKTNQITVTGGDQMIIVEGDGQITYNGNLTLNVSGDYHVKVGGDYHVTVGGDNIDQINGSRIERIEKDYETNVIKNRSQHIVGATQEIRLGNHYMSTKGFQKTSVQGDVQMLSSSETTLTSQNGIVMTSPDINMAAKSLSVFGDSGTVGGENIIMYNYNMYTGNSIVATDTVTTGTLYSTTADVEDHIETPVVVGSLAGTASKANSSPLGPGGSVGSAGTAHVTVDSKATALPTTPIVADYLHNTNKGVREVAIDPGEVVKNTLDLTVKTGGITTKKLVTSEVRSKLRDPNNIRNETFLGRMIAEGAIHGSATNPTPKRIGRTVSTKTSVARGETPIGNSSRGRGKKWAAKNIVTEEEHIPDHRYNPEHQAKITSQTKLADGITMAKFLGGYGEPLTLTHISEHQTKLKLAKQYYLQSQAMLTISEHEGDFRDHRLIVAEGFYRPTDSESLDKGDSVNYLKTLGQAVIYDLIDLNGKATVQSAYDLACYWRDSIKYDKIILDYDTYNLDGSINAQVILVMPEVFESWLLTYDNQIETRYNNYVQTTGEFLEIFE